MSDSEQFLCPICLEEGDEMLAELRPCKHMFHTECIRKWHMYANDLKCPTCRIESKTLICNVAGRQEVDLCSGFRVRVAVGGQQDLLLQHLNDSFNDIVRVENTSRQRSRSRVIQCNICGADARQIDRCCDHCDLFFHESCLRSLACEVGDPQSWKQCLECREAVSSFGSNRGREIANYDSGRLIRFEERIRARSSFATERLYRWRDNTGYNDSNTTSVNAASGEELAKLRSVKHKIQNHVRNALHPYYTTGKNGITIDDEQFSLINKNVSRNMYKASRYEYQQGVIDYDLVAQREIRTELFRLGLSDL